MIIKKLKGGLNYSKETNQERAGGNGKTKTTPRNRKKEKGVKTPFNRIR